MANRFGLSKTTVFEWSKRLTPKTTRIKKPKKIHDDVLRKDIEDHPDSYCYEKAARLGVSASGIWDAQYRLGVSYKKTQNHTKADPEKKSTFCQRRAKVER